MIRFVLAFLVLGLLISCGKDEDKENPKVEIISPTGIDTPAVGIDSLLLNFKLTDNTNLSQYSYVIKDSFEVKYDVGAKFISGPKFEHRSFVKFGGFGGVQKLWLYITVYDRAYNKTVVSKIFHIQP